MNGLHRIWGTHGRGEQYIEKFSKNAVGKGQLARSGGRWNNNNNKVDLEEEWYEFMDSVLLYKNLV
jgi:flagellar basal body rod protein FlgB